MLLQLITIAGCSAVAYQDFKDRAVLWVLFPIVAVALFLGHVEQISLQSALMFSGMNLLVIGTILGILLLYTKFIMKVPFLNHAFGLGDVLFFMTLSMGYPTVTFIILLVSAILFSMLAYMVLGLIKKMETVPLAGLMGIFLIGILIASWFSGFPSLYMI